MKAYIIVQGGNLADLQDRVEELAVEGYDPVGGVSLIASRVVQAVYKPKVINLFKGHIEPMASFAPHPVVGTADAVKDA